MRIPKCPFCHNIDEKDSYMVKIDEPQEEEKEFVIFECPRCYYRIKVSKGRINN